MSKQLPQIISKHKIFRFTGEDGKQYALTAKEKRFVECYLELQGNGTEAIINAGYNVKNSRGEINRNLARSMASENLMKPAIYMYLTILLSREGFNSENVDKQHLFLINQFSDLSAKSKGIDMFNRLKGRYPKDQVEISLVTKYQNVSDNELDQIINGEAIKDDA